MFEASRPSGLRAAYRFALFPLLVPLLLPLALLAGSIRAAHAAPLYSVEIQDADIDTTSEFPLNEAHSFYSPIVSGNYYFETASAAVGPGYIRASAHGNIFFPDMAAVGTSGVFADTDANASFRLDDVVISGPGTQVDSVLRLHLSGGTGAFAQARNLDGFGREAEADGSVTVTVFVAGSLFSGTRSSFRVADVVTGENGGSFESGILDGVSGTELEIALSNLPVNSPFVVQLVLDVSESATVRFAGGGGLPAARYASGSASFSSTLSFALSGPVFEVPPGYSVNSPSGLIVDNQWAGAPSPVPALSPMGLGALVLALAAAARWVVGTKGRPRLQRRR